MNYGKDATEKRLQAANSRSDKYRSRIFSYLYKDLLRALSVLRSGHISIGIGIVMGISRQCPELNVDSIVPIGYATTVYDSTGNLTDTLVTAGSNREEATFASFPRILINAFCCHRGLPASGPTTASICVLFPVQQSAY